MATQNLIQRRISILLVITLFFSGLFSFPVNSDAASITTTKTVTKTEAVNDTGSYDVWKHADGTWQYGVHPGDEVTFLSTFNVSTLVNSFPEGAKITKITGEFNKKYNDDDYSQYMVKWTELSGSPTYSATTQYISYNVHTYLTTESGAYDGENIKKTEQLKTVEGLRYYTPFTFYITYTYEVTETIESGDFVPGLSVPSSVKVGESFSAIDISVFDKDSDFDHSELTYNIDGGSQVTVTDWEGFSLGLSILQSFDEVCTVNYTLTVHNIYGESKAAKETVEVVDGREISGQAVLEVNPQVTHETHPVDAYDESTFDVDGESYSAKRAYEENIASNSFKTSSGTVKKDGSTAAILTYPKKGTYPVTLTIKLKNTGATLKDTKNVEVLKTPYVYDSLGGFQKQNRKQILTFRIATAKDKPIVDYDITIKDLKSNEIISLTKAAPQENGAVIKTRTVKNEVQDPYWTTLTVEFLTKYPRYSLTGEASQKFSYKIKVTDSKGDSDEAYKEFEVAPDVPPIPLISMQDSFLREAGTNTANIEAADASSSDGDQLVRTWSVVNHSPLTGLAIGQANALATIPTGSFVNATLLSGYENLAFGSNQTIGFHKEGVGKSTVKLHVKDVWNEPTLEEYINPSDYLEAETIASTKVINIAPVVSIEPIETLKANIAIMVAKNQLDTVKNQSNSIKADLLQKGIDGNISFIPVAENYDGEMTREGAAVNPKGASSLGQSVSSSDYTYVMEATSVTVTSNMTTAENVKIVAYDKTGIEKWNYAFSEPPQYNSLFVDNQEKYLLFSNSHYTLIFNAKTGALLTKLDSVGIHQNSKVFLSSDEKRMYFFNELGIQKIDFKTGQYKTVLSGNLSLPKLIGGKVGFVGQMSDMRYYIGKFDMTSELCDKLAMPTVNFYKVENTQGTSWVKPVDWSNDGKVLVVRRLQEYWDGESGGQAWVLDANTQTQCYVSVPVGDDKGWESFFVKDQDGNANYFSVAYGYQGTTKYYNNLAIYKANGTGTSAEVVSSWNSGKTGSTRLSNTGYYDKETNKIYIFDLGYYGRCWIYNLTNNRFEEASSNLSVVGFDPITGRVSSYDGGLVSHYYDNGWNGNSSFYYILRYKTPITSNQSAYKGIIEKADFGEGENYIVNYGLGGLSRVEELASIKNALMLSIESNIESLAEKIEEIGTAPQYMLNLIGNGISNIGSIFKSINLDPNAEYEYSYDLQTVSGSGIDVFKESHTNTINGSGTTYYKEVVYQADLTNGSSEYITKGFVSYDSGYWFNKSKYGQAGYGCGQTSKNGNSGGPVISFTMEKDGYVEFSMAGYGARNISLDGKRLYRSEDSKYLLFLSAGKHTLRMQTDNLDYQSVLQNIEIGYLTTSDNSFSSSPVTANTRGIQTVEGCFKAGKEVAYTEVQSQSFQSLNIYDMLNKGYLTFYEESNNANSISADGRNVTASYHGRTPNSGKITTRMNFKIVAPSDKMLLINYGNDNRLLSPSEIYSQRVSSQGYHVYSTTFISDFYAVEIPIDSLGMTLSSAISYGSASICIPKYTLKNRNSYFYNITFPTSTTAKIAKCISGAGAPTSKILFTTEKSSSLFRSIVSNFVLKSKYSAVNIKGTYLTDDFCSANGLSLNGWNKLITGSGKAEIEFYEPAEKEEDALLIYKKGQLIKYGINYSDYENDPSKSGYWLYAHTPYNDGEHPDGAIIYDEDGNIKSVCGQVISTGAITIDEALSIAKSKGLKTLAAPIDRFYVDGKYTVYHWEYDNTSRGIVASGYPTYDKVSNTAELTFYVEGGASAPWITGISTSPTKVTENKYFSMNIGIDDVEKDILNLTTEVYKDRKLIYTYRKKNILPIEAAGNPTTNAAIAIGYPVLNTGALPDKAEAGTYEVVATVRDQTGAGLGTYKFIVVSEGKIIGYVNHTDKWEENRKKYNLSWFDREVNIAYAYADYLELSEPRKRGTNVFWSGEKFMLRAAVAGSPTKVTCNINEISYSSTMSSSGTKNAEGETIYTGSIWDEDMINKWGMKEPEQLTFTFTATYSGGTVKTHKATVIVDNMNPYWRLHRAF